MKPDDKPIEHPSSNVAGADEQQATVPAGANHGGRPSEEIENRIPDIAANEFFACSRRDFNQ